MEIPFNPEINGTTILAIYELTPQDAIPVKSSYSPNGINHCWKGYPIPRTKCSISLPTEENPSHTYDATCFHVIFKYWFWKVRLSYDEGTHHEISSGYNIEIRGPKIYLQQKEVSLREALDFLQKQLPSFEGKKGWKQFNPIIQKLIKDLRQYA